MIRVHRRHPTNRWTGATGSEFRIKRGPAKVLGNAVARSTQPFGGFRALPSDVRCGFASPDWLSN